MHLLVMLEKSIIPFKILIDFKVASYPLLYILHLVAWLILWHSDALTEDDWKLMQLILTLFKNILAIQEISLQQKAGGTISHFLSLRDRFLELLFRENVMDLIIVITQHFGGYLRNDNLLLLEIFHYIFMGQEPELIAKAHQKGSKVGSPLFFPCKLSFCNNNHVPSLLKNLKIVKWTLSVEIKIKL